jgi:putative sterol carrier protein
MKLSTIIVSLAATATLGYASAATAAPVFMSGEWGAAMCKAWNADPVLTKKLKESGWVDNNNKRGYKIMQIYTNDCPNAPRVEMRIQDQDGIAKCTYGGLAQSDKPDTSFDYIMHASTKNWKKMGAGDLGPMWAMTTFRLKFSGPMGEAMSNMGPFKSFLRLTGKVEADFASCPASAE